MNITICCDKQSEYLSEDDGGLSLHEEAYVGHTFSAHAEGSKYSVYNVEETYDLDCEKGDAVWLAYVLYTDGDSFGKTSGYVKCLGLFKNEEDAQKLLKKELKEGNQTGKKRKYKCWNGYFSGLDESDVISLVVQ